MSEQWEYQIRIELGDEFAEMARRDLDYPVMRLLADVLVKHRATMKCQFDAFADYVTEAEEQGTEKFPLYAWTKATIENLEKRAKYLKSFTIYVDGKEVYPKSLADTLETELRPLVCGKLIIRLSRYDTNPANNPQAPPEHRQG